MGVKKVSKDQIPQNLLGDLEALLPSTKKTYVAIGESFYEVTPSSAVVLMEALATLVETLDNIRKKKIQRLLDSMTEEEKKSFDTTKVTVTVEEVMTDPEGVERMKSLIPKLLEGVDPEDMKKITMGQLLDALEKIVAVNIDSLPPSYKKLLQQTPAGDVPKNP